MKDLGIEGKMRKEYVGIVIKYSGWRVSYMVVGFFMGF